MRQNQFQQPYRFIYEENVYFSRRQLAALLGISESCLSKQLKHLTGIPGCQKERFYDYPHESRRHYKIVHYNLNTAVGVAFRVNNAKCRRFLEDYHRTLFALHFRMRGTNCYVPSILTAEEFHRYADQLGHNVGEDPEYADWQAELGDLIKELEAKRHQSANQNPD